MGLNTRGVWNQKLYIISADIEIVCHCQNSSSLVLSHEFFRNRKTGWIATIFNFVLRICCLILFILITGYFNIMSGTTKKELKQYLFNYKQMFSIFLIKYVLFLFTRRLGSIEMHKGVNGKTVRAANNDLSNMKKWKVVI